MPAHAPNVTDTARTSTLAHHKNGRQHTLASTQEGVHNLHATCDSPERRQKGHWNEPCFWIWCMRIQDSCSIDWDLNKISSLIAS
jgi:hypothetical protein